jgi:hypothetical protein
MLDILKHNVKVAWQPLRTCSLFTHLDVCTHIVMHGSMRSDSAGGLSPPLPVADYCFAPRAEVPAEASKCVCSIQAIIVSSNRWYRLVLRGGGEVRPTSLLA